MKKDPNVYLLQILDAIKIIKNYTKNISERGFMETQQLMDAVSYRLQVIGEAGSHLPKSIQEKIKSPWNKIIGMRNILVHGYDDLDYEEIWLTVKKDIKELEKEIKKYLRTNP